MGKKFFDRPEFLYYLTSSSFFRLLNSKKETPDLDVSLFGAGDLVKWLKQWLFKG